MGYPLPFIDNAICTFKENNMVDQNNVMDDNDGEPLIPPYFFEVYKRFILLKLPFCHNNEIKSKHILKKSQHFTKIVLILESDEKKENINSVSLER